MSVFGPGAAIAASDINLSGPYANLPIAGIKGRIYQPTDSVYELLHDNGSSWQHFCDGKLMTLPVNGDFSWVNQGPATVTTKNGVLLMKDNDASSGFSMRMRVKSAPATPWTVTIATYANHQTDDDTHSGLVVRESSTGKFHTCAYGVTTPGITCFHTMRMDSPTVRNVVNPFGTGGATGQYRHDGIFRLAWFRLTDEGGAGDLILETSCDGINWIEISKFVPRTLFLATGPDEIGFFVNSGSILFYCDMSLVHWKET